MQVQKDLANLLSKNPELDGALKVIRALDTKIEEDIVAAKSISPEKERLRILLYIMAPPCIIAGLVLIALILAYEESQML